MLERFQKALIGLTGEDPGRQRFLLAVSGGLDSVVLLRLFALSGYSFAVAHGNFALRGAESDADERFVHALAEQSGVPVFSCRFPTQDHARARRISIQMAARDLRYEWLETVRREQGFDWLVTAHHWNDSLETFFINLLRGSGLRGLAGIPARNDRILRPLNGFTRAALESFYQEQGLIHREDASNTETYYLRNQIRLLLLPVLRHIQPGFERQMDHTFHALRGALQIYAYALQNLRQTCVETKDSRVLIHWPRLEGHPAAAAVCFELLAPYGFRPEQAESIWKGRKGQPGQLFFAADFQLLIDRETFILEKRILVNSPFSVEIDQAGVYMLPEGQLSLTFAAGALPPEWPDGGREVLVNAEKLQFPLHCRPWAPGDFLYPLGMKGKRKKVQDILTDSKIDRFAKDRALVLENGDGRIIWLIGYRLDERFKLNKDNEQPFWRITHSGIS
ncbi:MAG: tRNA lysidine(34) synthetase TilS [Haliscomenobacter sp.]|nr:tRNA lysidine(34) synthetase TilS [Haliscomenobacter sp.]